MQKRGIGRKAVRDGRRGGARKILPMGREVTKHDAGYSPSMTPNHLEASRELRFQWDRSWANKFALRSISKTVFATLHVFRHYGSLAHHALIRVKHMHVGISHVIWMYVDTMRFMDRL